MHIENIGKNYRSWGSWYGGLFYSAVAGLLGFFLWALSPLSPSDKRH